MAEKKYILKLISDIELISRSLNNRKVVMISGIFFKSLCSPKLLNCFVLLITALLFNTAYSNPHLLFDSADLPGLQYSVNSPQLKPVWDQIQARVGRYCNPSDSLYVDPQGSFFTDPQDDGWFGRKVFSWVEPIGFAYQITGNSVYGTHGAAILDAAIDYSPEPGALASGECLDMFRAIAFGYDWLSSAMTVEQRQRAEQKAREYVEWAVADNINRYYHNFMGVGYGGAGLAALAVKDVYPSLYQQWLDFCIERVSFWFENSFDPQGAYAEGHYYLQYGLANSIPFAVALNRSEGIDLLEGSRLQNISNYLAMIRLPGSNVFEARNSSTYSSSLDVMLKYLVGYYEDGLLAQLLIDASWTQDYVEGGYNPVRLLPQWNVYVEPVKPALGYMQTGEHFTERGLVVFRTGWQESDVMFSIESGKFYHLKGGAHNQADKGHFNIYGLGRMWAVDPGVAALRWEPLGRGQTIDHSCILVNGKGQAISGGGIGTNGEILIYEDNYSYGYALADCTQAYNRDEHIVDKAFRHSLFVRPSLTTPAYVVLLDDIYKGSGVNEFQWQMIGSHDANIIVGDSINGVYQATVLPKETKLDRCMDVQISAQETIDIVSTTYNPLTGSPSQYPKIEAISNAVNPRFVTVLSVRMADQAKPEIIVSREDAITITIQWADSYDTLVWEGDDVAFTMGYRCMYDIPGDFNNDCTVDMSDFVIFSGEWLK